MDSHQVGKVMMNSMIREAIRGALQKTALHAFIVEEAQEEVEGNHQNLALVEAPTIVAN